jgi:glucose/arabinose dehydrogenase
VPTAGPADPTQVRLELETVVSNLDRPLGIVHAGDGSGRLFILEKPGRIRILRSDALEDRPFLDLTDRVGSSGSEQGLLGLAFHPNYADNGRLFTNYTDRNGDTVISQFLVSDDPDRAEPGSEQVLLTLDQPAANHNGGHLAFGPDGYLYIGTGDGGAAGDQFGNGQNARTLLGAMLRLDIDSAQPYAIPGDNPFVGDDAARDELWAIGLRNPWRYSFDRLTGDLYIADVGQNTYEEVNRQPASSAGGENYGWPIMEGLHCFPADGACDQSGLVLPVHEYDHSQGCSVTGGYVYRGQRYPVLQGIYLFGDYCSGIIWGMAAAGGDSWRTAKLLQTDARISSFGEDEAGELYLVDIAGGGLSRLTATPAE